MAVEPDIWVVHPGINTGTGSDRVSLEMLGLTMPGTNLNNPAGRAWVASAKTALRAFFINQVPSADWDTVTWEFTDRSTPQQPELLIYPGTLYTKVTAQQKLSPARADNGR